MISDFCRFIEYYLFASYSIQNIYYWLKLSNHMYVNNLLAMSFTIQSTPYNNPSPDLALHPIAPQWRVFTVSN